MCCSASETSKGSTLSLSRYQARERARHRAAKEKENDEDASHHQNLITHSSFTDLLNAGPTVEVGDCGTDFDQKHLRPQLPSSTADYVGQDGLFGQTHRIPHLLPGYSTSLMHLGNNPHMGRGGMMAYNAASAGEHQEMQQFSFMQDHVIPVSAPGVDYDLNVSISSVF
ncbi:hypothetical protein KSP40_PGU021034 [Platanthera guangdongensis]|uniref:Uncharacterized protein n=1 Tax=Platanthera guangdongensis TaxID=2320717 RepID=A0ABR2M080_9ASPA